MTRIRLHEHPFSGAPAQEFEAETAGHWLMARYPGGASVTLQMYRGEPSRETEITRNLDALTDPSLQVCTVLQSPGYEAIAYAAAYVVELWAAYGSYVQLALAAYSVGSALLASSPGMPGNVNRTSASPNNALAGRENQPRLRQRIEDIYGTVLSIPSVMMVTYQKRINNRRVEFAYYCVGRGYYDIARLRDADILVSDIPGASAAVYAPFTSPNSGDAPQLLIGDPIIDAIVNVLPSKQVDGLTLKAQNQVQLPASAEYTFVAAPGGDIIRQSTKAPNFTAVAAVGDEIVVPLGPVDMTLGDGVDIGFTIDATANTIQFVGAADLFDPIEVGEAIVVSGFSSPGNNGTFTVLARPAADKLQLSGSGRTDEGPITTPRVTFTRDYDGTYEIASVADGEVVLTTSTWVSDSPAVTAAVQLVGKVYITPWFTLPTKTRTEVWVTVAAFQGMFRDSGGKSLTSVDFAIEIERLDADDLTPTGEVETVTGSMNGQSSDELGQTIEHVTAWTGACRVRMVRTTPYDYAFNGAIVDEIKWDNLSAVSPVDQLHFGQLTTIQTVTPATIRATSLQTRQLNCLAGRKLPTYNGSVFSGVIDAEGRHVGGTMHVTSKMVDILAAVFVDPLIGKREIDELDLAQVWATQQALDAWHPEMGQFNYTFDTDNFTFENTVDAIARAAFCRAYRFDRTRVQFERQQSTSAALFTHRNKEPRAEILTRTFANDSDNDGVEFVYRDPDTEQAETIRIPLDGSAQKPRKIEMPGIRSFAQAWRHAWRAYYKLIGQRLAIETSCTIDARLLLPLQRIDIVDNTRYKSNDGEVVGQAGLVLRLSQPVHFTAGGVPHSIVLMRRDGSCQGIACTAGEDEYHVVLQSLPTEAILTQYGPDGIRTIYSFAADADRGKVAFLVDEIDAAKGNYVTVRGVNYSDGYYAKDHTAIPAAAGVIN